MQTAFTSTNLASQCSLAEEICTPCLTEAFGVRGMKHCTKMPNAQLESLCQKGVVNEGNDAVVVTCVSNKHNGKADGVSEWLSIHNHKEIENKLSEPIRQSICSCSAQMRAKIEKNMSTPCKPFPLRSKREAKFEGVTEWVKWHRKTLSLSTQGSASLGQASASVNPTLFWKNFKRHSMWNCHPSLPTGCDQMCHCNVKLGRRRNRRKGIKPHHWCKRCRRVQKDRQNQKTASFGVKLDQRQWEDVSENHTEHVCIPTEFHRMVSWRTPESATQRTPERSVTSSSTAAATLTFHW